jgi:hypothetical protein
MNHVPRIGEGVLVPWGLSDVPGEVIDLRDPTHAVVAVRVEGASGEELDTTHATFDVGMLRELPPWRPLRVREGRPAAGADATKAWYVDASRNGDEARVEVRLSGSAAASRNLPQEAQRAVQTRGKSAVEKYAFRFRLPRVVVVASTGVFELRE